MEKEVLMETNELTFDSEGLLFVPRWSPTGLLASTPENRTKPQGNRQVSERRAEALRRFFPKLANWLDRVHFSQMPAVERYLSQATDLCDLEQRIRDVERRGWH